MSKKYKTDKKKKLLDDDLVNDPENPMEELDELDDLFDEVPVEDIKGKIVFENLVNFETIRENLLSLYDSNVTLIHKNDIISEYIDMIYSCVDESYSNFLEYDYKHHYFSSELFIPIVMDIKKIYGGKEDVLYPKYERNIKTLNNNKPELQTQKKEDNVIFDILRDNKLSDKTRYSKYTEIVRPYITENERLTSTEDNLTKNPGFLNINKMRNKFMVKKYPDGYNSKKCEIINSNVSIDKYGFDPYYFKYRNVQEMDHAVDVIRMKSKHRYQMRRSPSSVYLVNGLNNVIKYSEGEKLNVVGYVHLSPFNRILNIKKLVKIDGPLKIPTIDNIIKDNSRIIMKYFENYSQIDRLFKDYGWSVFNFSDVELLKISDLFDKKITLLKKSGIESSRFISRHACPLLDNFDKNNFIRKEVLENPIILDAYDKILMDLPDNIMIPIVFAWLINKEDRGDLYYDVLAGKDVNERIYYRKKNNYWRSRITTYNFDIDDSIKLKIQPYQIVANLLEDPHVKKNIDMQKKVIKIIKHIDIDAGFQMEKEIKEKDHIVFDNYHGYGDDGKPILLGTTDIVDEYKKKEHIRKYMDRKVKSNFADIFKLECSSIKKIPDNIQCKWLNSMRLVLNMMLYQNIVNHDPVNDILKDLLNITNEHELLEIVKISGNISNIMQKNQYVLINNPQEIKNFIRYENLFDRYLEFINEKKIKETVVPPGKLRFVKLPMLVKRKFNEGKMKEIHDLIYDIISWNVTVDSLALIIVSIVVYFSRVKKSSDSHSLLSKLLEYVSNGLYDIAIGAGITNIKDTTYIEKSIIGIETERFTELMNNGYKELDVKVEGIDYILNFPFMYFDKETMFMKGKLSMNDVVIRAKDIYKKVSETDIMKNKHSPSGEQKGGASKMKRSYSENAISMLVNKLSSEHSVDKGVKFDNVIHLRMYILSQIIFMSELNNKFNVNTKCYQTYEINEWIVDKTLQAKASSKIGSLTKIREENRKDFYNDLWNKIYRRPNWPPYRSKDGYDYKIYEPESLLNYDTRMLNKRNIFVGNQHISYGVTVTKNEINNMTKLNDIYVKKINRCLMYLGNKRIDKRLINFINTIGLLNKKNIGKYGNNWHTDIYRGTMAHPSDCYEVFMERESVRRYYQERILFIIGRINSFRLIMSYFKNKVSKKIKKGLRGIKRISDIMEKYQGSIDIGDITFDDFINTRDVKFQESLYDEFRSNDRASSEDEFRSNEKPNKTMDNLVSFIDKIHGKKDKRYSMVSILHMYINVLLSDISKQFTTSEYESYCWNVDVDDSSTSHKVRKSRAKSIPPNLIKYTNIVYDFIKLLLDDYYEMQDNMMGIERDNITLAVEMYTMQDRREKYEALGSNELYWDMVHAGLKKANVFDEINEEEATKHIVVSDDPYDIDENEELDKFESDEFFECGDHDEI